MELHVSALDGEAPKSSECAYFSATLRFDVRLSAVPVIGFHYQALIQMAERLGLNLGQCHFIPAGAS